MSSIFVSLPILIITLGASIFYGRSFGAAKKPPTADFYKKVFYVSAVIIFLFLSVLSFLQYKVWKGDELMKYSLPPFNGWFYFLFYVFTRFFAPYVISFAGGIIFIFVSRRLNKKYNEKFFYEEEYWLGAIGIFLTAYPAFIFYFMGILLSILIGSAISRERFSAYYVWLPLAIFVILIQGFLQGNQLWSLLKI